MEYENELNNNLMSGNIRIIKSQIAFQRVAKDIINRKDVDPFTLGIYVKVLVLGEKWELNVSGLARHLGITDTKIRRSFVLLENCGYIRRIHIKDGKTGRFTGWDYEIGEEPFPETDRSNLSKIQPLENPEVGKSKVWKIQPLENREGIIKDSTEIEELHTTTPPTSPQGEKPKQSAFTPPTLQEVADYARERGFADPAGFAEFFITICTNNGWRRAEGRGKPIVNWKNYIVSCWEPNRKDHIFQQREQNVASRIVAMDPSTFKSIIP